MLNCSYTARRGWYFTPARLFSIAFSVSARATRSLTLGIEEGAELGKRKLPAFVSRKLETGGGVDAGAADGGEDLAGHPLAKGFGFGLAADEYQMV